ncbi:MAG: hypothetical protein MJZ32_06530 [Bacteroidaceae bacterium]|nr:hypothetical protein [Bacteroidaceae bacterium]
MSDSLLRAEKLIEDHGLTGAEKMLREQPWLTAEIASEMQSPAMLQAYELLAESLIDNDMIYLRDKLELASATTVSIGKNRARKGGNDIIYNRLPDKFSFEQAMGAKGNGCSRNSVHQMLKNWKSQKLITQMDATAIIRRLGKM